MKFTPVIAGKKLVFTKGIILLLSAFCLLPACIFAFRRPAYNWDMLAYMAIVLKAGHPGWDVNRIHERTYQIAKQKVPATEYGYLIQSAYQERMAKDPSAFYAQLPFYAVKPLYLAMIYMLYKAGIGLPVATLLPSILAYFCMGLLLFHWLGRYLKLLLALISSLLIMYATFMILLARISTPDAVSSLWLLAAFYFILEKPSTAFMFLFFLLSVFTRLDNIVTCFIILSFLFFVRKWKKQIFLRQYVLMMLALIISYFAITLVTVRPFGWNILYYPAFVHYFNLSYAFHPLFSLKAYLALLYSHAITTIVFHHFTLFAFLALVVSIPISRHPLPKIGFDQWFCMLLIFIILIRFILYPNIDDRFYISFYVCILILLVKKFDTSHSHYRKKLMLKQEHTNKNKSSINA